MKVYILKKVIEAKNIIKTYADRVVINNVSLDVFEGDFISIIGESGAGKSTLLYILAGIESPDSGSVFINGTNIVSITEKELAKMRSSVFGFVFQFDNLLQNLTIMENILLPLVINGKLSDTKKSEAFELLEYMNILNIKNKLPAQVSGGEQQRASIARALIINPAILFLDEPTGSLDSQSSQQVMDLLKKINYEKKVAIVQVTHSSINAKVARRIIEIKDGALVYDV